MKNLKEIHNLIRSSEFTTKIQIFFNSRSYGDDYDPETNNYTTTYKNPITIKGLVRQIAPESAVWKAYGVATSGAVEIITEKKHAEKFRNCVKVEIDSIDYNVLRDKTGSNASIISRPNNLVRISLIRS